MRLSACALISAVAAQNIPKSGIVYIIKTDLFTITFFGRFFFKTYMGSPPTYTKCNLYPWEKNDFVQKERAREFGWDLLFSSGSSDENKVNRL